MHSQEAKSSEKREVNAMNANLRQVGNGTPWRIRGGNGYTGIITAATLIIIVAMAAQFLLPGDGITGTWETDDGQKVTFCENGTVISEDDGDALEYVAEDGNLIVMRGCESMEYRVSGNTLTLMSDGQSFEMYRAG